MNNADAIVCRQLQQQLLAHQGQGLWVVDENMAQFAPDRVVDGLSLLSNRVDIQEEMSALGWPVSYSDFDFSPWHSQPLDRIYYRISKEKAVVHHVINEAFRCLKPDGELLLVGAKNEGAKSYYDKARKLFGEGELSKAGKGVYVAHLTRSNDAADEWLDDRDYRRQRVIAEVNDHSLLSKPGTFGWDKIDVGSQYLADNLDVIYQRLKTDKPKVLDLGCGYGYLSIRVASRELSELVATDNNAAAIACCRKNLENLGPPYRVIADNCAQSISEKFDLIVCNPPFHQGFSVEGELTDRFIATAARLLAAGGQAAFVVNRFIPLERKAAGLFAEIETFADNGSFKLVRMARPSN
ncbi:MAG: methyltransferase [Motiliproteus sp.]